MRAPGLSRASFPIIVVLCGGVIFVQKKSFARFACTQSAFLIERQKTQNVVLLDVPSKECHPQILGEKTERAKIHPNAPAKEDAILFFSSDIKIFLFLLVLDFLTLSRLSGRKGG